MSRQTSLKDLFWVQALAPGLVVVDLAVGRVL